SGEKARAHAPGDRAEPQIDARRLDLRKFDLLGGDDLAPRAYQLFENVAGQNARGVAPLLVRALPLFKKFCIAHRAKLARAGAGTLAEIRAFTTLNLHCCAFRFPPRRPTREGERWSSRADRSELRRKGPHSFVRVA